MSDSNSTLDDEVDDYDGDDYSPERADSMRAALAADLGQHRPDYADAVSGAAAIADRIAATTAELRQLRELRREAVLELSAKGISERAIGKIVALSGVRIHQILAGTRPGACPVSGQECTCELAARCEPALEQQP